MPAYPRHMVTGDAFPSLEAGKLRIYSMQFCPFAQRARLVAEAKGLDYEVINCNLKTKPEWLFEKNPNGQVPALEHDGKILYESLVVSDYLDDAYPGRKLTAADPYQRGKDNIIVSQFGNKVIPAYYKALRAPAEEKEAAMQSLIEKLTVFDQIIAKRGTKYLGGAEVGMVDLMVWPWCHGLNCQSSLSIIFEKCPNLKKWLDNMYTEKAVKATSQPAELLLKFYQGYQSQNPVFDF